MRDFYRVETGTLTYRSVNRYGNGTSSSESYPERTESFHANRSKTPNYWKLKKAGAPIPDQPYSCYRNSSRKMNGTFIRRFWSTPWGSYADREEYSGVISEVASGNNPGPDRIPLDTGLDYAKAKANLDVRNRLKGSNFNAVVAAAEMGQTVSMIAGFAKAASDSFQGFRRGDVHAAARALGCKPLGRRARAKFRREYTYDQSKAAANAWLAYKYGWLPTIQDVVAAAELAASRIELPPPQRVSASFSHSALDSQDFDPPWHWYGSGGPVKTVTSSINVSCRTVLVFRQSGAPQLPTALGLTNPALVAWELVPLSFVVDWFLPVGDVLNSLDSTIGWDFVRGFSTIKVAEQHSQRWHGQYYYGWDEKREIDAYASQSSKYFARELHKSFPSVDYLALVSPPKVNATAARFASAISLLRQIFK